MKEKGIRLKEIGREKGRYKMSKTEKWKRYIEGEKEEYYHFKTYLTSIKFAYFWLSQYVVWYEWTNKKRYGMFTKI